MPRYSIKDSLFATALVALGILMVSTLFKYPPGRDPYPIFVLWFGGGAMIAAGTFTPFGKPWRGAVVGLAIQVVVGLFVAVVTG